MKITRISISLRYVWPALSRRYDSLVPPTLLWFITWIGEFGTLMRSGIPATGLRFPVPGKVRTGPACWAILLLLGSGLCFVPRAHGEKIYAPDYLWQRGIAEKTDPIDIADAHLGIPYRDDGALDSEGRFTTFEDPSRIFPTPGLNCSGLVLSVSRFLYDRNWTLDEVMRDPQGNSGPTSPLGKDWDFGLDLILNISAGTARRVLMPDGKEHKVESFDGLNARGFDLHDRAAWRAVLGQMTVGRVYLGSINKATKKEGYRVLHYHVVLMLPDGKGNVWLYHATPRSNVHKMNMSSPKGMGRFMSQFTGAREDGKRIIVLESVLPQIGENSGAAADTGADKPPAAPEPAKVAEQPPVSAPPDTQAAAPPDEAKKPASALPVGSESPADQSAPSSGEATNLVANKDSGPERVINHLVGKVFKAIPGVTTAIPRFADDSKNALRFRFTNETPIPRAVEISVKGPDGTHQFSGTLGGEGSELLVHYPNDFGSIAQKPLQLGEYRSDVKLDGVPWLADIFEVAVPREASPKIVRVSAPSVVQAGKTFTVKIEAINNGAESDYGGITVSTPVPSGLRLRSANPGKVFSPGSTVLSVTSDRIRTKVPMAERWIELWGEKATYDMTLKLEAGRPGTYPLYVRCALRGVNVKSSVILMDPKASESVDQQGFPVYVHYIKVQ